jgi:hypothetical protein
VARESDSPAVDLSKWYLDVAAEDGRCAVFYAARLRILGLTFRASGVLLLAGGRVRSRWSLVPARAPRLDRGRLRLSAPALGLSGRLDAIDPPFDLRLHEGARGVVDWDCRMPRAEAELRVGGETIRGLGYAEHLRVTLPPWELPVRTLRWGRLLSPGGGLVWIDWQGPEPFRLALRDGRPARLDDAVDEAVTVDGQAHPLARLATLRDAPLSRTLPAALRRALPRVGLGLSETKWLARGSVGGASGLAIHEVVRWP